MKEIKRSFRKLAMGYHPDKNKSEGAQVRYYINKDSLIRDRSYKIQKDKSCT